MAGDSNRDKAANKLNSDLGNFGNQIQGTDFTVKNRFDTMDPQFGYNEMSGKMNDAFQSGINTINTQSDQASSDAGINTASRLASQGITSGSILNDAVSGNQNNVAKNRFSSLSDILGKRAQADVGVMNTANENIFRNTGAAQSVDDNNMMNKFRKYGLISGNYGQQMANTQNLDNTTFLDDIFAGINSVGNLAKGFNGFGLFGKGGDSGKAGEGK